MPGKFVSRIPIAVVVVALLLVPAPARANHGVEALGVVAEMLMIAVLVVLLPALIAFILAVVNISRKKGTLRVLSIFLTLPLLVASLWVVTVLPMVGLVGLMGVLLNGGLIYGSYKRS